MRIRAIPRLLFHLVLNDIDSITWITRVKEAPLRYDDRQITSGGALERIQ